MLAVMVKLYVPPEPAAGVPSKLAVSVPAWLVKVTPAGRAPVSDKVMSKPLLVRAGSPAVTSKVPAWPTVKVAASAEVNVGVPRPPGEGLGGVGAGPVAGGNGEAGTLPPERPPASRPSWRCRCRLGW